MNKKTQKEVVDPNKIRNVIHLEISSFLGSLGAEHYYAKLRWKDRTSKEYKTNEIEIRRKLGVKEAKYLNEKDSAYGSGIWRAGCMTERFNTPEHAIEFALKEFKKIPGENILIKSRHGVCSAAPIIAFPEWYAEKIQFLNGMAEEWRSMPRSLWNSTHATELDEKWYKEITKDFEL